MNNMAPARRHNPERRARELLVRLNIRGVPVPVERIGKALGAVIRYSPLDEELSGMIYVKDGLPIIGVNALHHPNRQRFTIAHEIGHLEMHRDQITDRVHVDKTFPIKVGGLQRNAKSALGTEPVEIEANRFAAALLIPESYLDQVLGDQDFDIDDDAPLEDLARKLRVSKQALEFRIRNLYLGHRLRA
jgi:Zn-dependent peptidase ImmA (M78 family)